MNSGYFMLQLNIMSKIKKSAISLAVIVILVIAFVGVISFFNTKNDVAVASSKIHKINNVSEINPNVPGVYSTKKITQVNGIKIATLSIFTVTDGSTESSGGICAYVQLLAYYDNGKLTHKWAHTATFSWNGTSAKVSNSAETFTSYDNIKIIKKTPSITQGVTANKAAWSKGQYFVKWYFDYSIYTNITTAFTKLKVSKNGHVVTNAYYKSGNQSTNNTTIISNIINGGEFAGELLKR
jgi:hypothetical protein